MMITTESANVIGRPDAFATAAANAVKALEKLIWIGPTGARS